MDLPESAVVVRFLGEPEETLKPSPPTTILVLYVEPVILRQSAQWQRACEAVLGQPELLVGTDILRRPGRVMTDRHLHIARVLDADGTAEASTLRHDDVSSSL